VSLYLSEGVFVGGECFSTGQVMRDRTYYHKMSSNEILVIPPRQGHAAQAIPMCYARRQCPRSRTKRGQVLFYTPTAGLKPSSEPSAVRERAALNSASAKVSLSQMPRNPHPLSVARQPNCPPWGGIKKTTCDPTAPSPAVSIPSYQRPGG